MEKLEKQELDKRIYSTQKLIEEVKASFRLSGMELTEEDIELLVNYRNGQITGKEVREKILKKCGQEGAFIWEKWLKLRYR